MSSKSPNPKLNLISWHVLAGESDIDPRIAAGLLEPKKRARKRKPTKRRCDDNDKEDADLNLVPNEEGSEWEDVEPEPEISNETLLDNTSEGELKEDSSVSQLKEICQHLDSAEPVLGGGNSDEETNDCPGPNPPPPPIPAPADAPVDVARAIRRDFAIRA